MRAKLRVNYLFFYSVLGTYCLFISVYLESRGLTGTQIGTILGTSPLFVMVTLPLFGFVSDKLNAPRKVIFVISLVAVVFALSIMKVSTFWYLFVFIILYEMFMVPILQLSDSLTLRLSKKYNYKYTKIRVFGSLGYVAGGVLSGYLIDLMGLSAMFYYIALFLILTGIITLTYSDLDETHQHKIVNLKKEISEIFKCKSFILIIGITCLTYVIGDALILFNGNFILELGGRKVDIGLAALGSVTFEVIIFTFNKQIMQKIGPKKMLLISVVAIFLRFFIGSNATTVWQFYIAVSMHGIAFATCLPVAYMYIIEKIPKNVNATAITIMVACQSIVRSGVIFLTGYVYENYSLRLMYLILSFLTLLAIPLIMKLKPIDVKEQLKIEDK